MTKGIGKGLGTPWQSPHRGSNPVGSPDRVRYATDNAPIRGPKPKGPGGSGNGGGQSGGGDGRGRGRASITPIRMVQAALRGTTGTQDFTIEGFGTPVAALFVVGNGGVSQTPTDGARPSIGATDGTNHWVISVTDRHGQASSDLERRAATDEVIMILTAGGGVLQEANFDSFITDGVRINLAVTDGGLRAVTCYLVGGTDVTAAVGSGPLGDSSATVTFTPNLEMNALIMGTTLDLIDDVADVSGVIEVGFGTWDGSTVLQNSYHWTGIDNQASGDPRSKVRNDKIFSRAGTQFATLENITSTQFDMTSSADDNTGMGIGWLAINLGSKGEAWTGVETMPTSTGNHVISGVGFKPSFGMFCATMIDTLTTQQIDDTAGAFAISGFNVNEEFCHSWANEDASATTDTQSVTRDVAIDLDDDDGTDGFEGTFSSFTNDGAIINFSIVPGTARLWPTLFMKI